ncbi:hypothetical protein DK26_24775 [Bosea sp. WAO]|uniref:leukotoxin LktA family filamentous adhesin n=1 Tax=Bosea sp. WAO TaxID=406341 RepID=UPI000748E2CE|nr:leukotoxin LktA family filamentous adhesin [Bosea sp. WAO]KUL93263.1 hypothetical protein DK26_24775 [Bosea sp. WAO]
MSKRRSLRPATAFLPRTAGPRQRDVFAPRPRSVLATWRERCLVGQAMALALWNAPAFAQNIITPDGRTQTNVSVSGGTTTITTQTVSGGAGYNSFSRFEQAAGTTVNMHLPQNTGALVNIVRDGPVVINGILNSYRNGQIGGHVYFSDSAGFTVGPSGVINTGQLTVNTPTRAFLDQVIGPNGVVNEAMAARLRANDVPISPDGTITIDGRINARRGVSLNGHTVSVAGQINANTAAVDISERRRQHRAAFAQSVNTAGLQQGGAMVARRGGGIEIVAAGTASISGTLNAKATAHRPAGTIAVRSGKGTTIAATARINATGSAPGAAPISATPGSPNVNTADGGSVSILSGGAISIARGAVIDVSGAQAVAAKGGSAVIFADTNLDVQSGAIFRGTAGITGDGGFLELSAKNTVTLGAVDVDLSARSGKAGLLYIDPTDIVIGAGGSANMITNGTNVSLEATNSITIAGDGIIDTRNFNRSAGALSALNPSLGNSGSITLTAPSITVRGTLLAGVSAGSSHIAGDVTLDATTSQRLIGGRASASSTIDIYGTITGRDVLLKADATAIASYIDPSAGPLVALAAQTAAGAALGLNGGYVGSEITSRVQVASGATIEASRDVSLTAKGRQEASLPAITVNGNSVFGGAVSIGEISGTVTADIASGATIRVGRDLAVKAENDVKLGVSAISVTVGETLAAATVAFGSVDVSTAAKVHSGATIVTGGVSNVSITAFNTNSFSTSANSIAASGGVAGASIAYSDYRAQADALLGASLGTEASKLKRVTVSAVSDTTKNATSASTTVGDNLIFNAGPAGTTVSTLLSQLLGKLSSGSSSVPVKAGSAIAIADSSLVARAAIAADPGGAAPTLHSDGNVVVASRQSDFGVRLIADSSINSNSKDPTSAQPEAQVSLSFAIGVGNYAHESTASIGSGVTINAYRVGVGATNEMPISNTWTNWAGPLEVVSHLNGNLGTVNNIMTSYANASSQSQQLGLAGSVSYFRVDNETSAYVASGATLNTTALAPSWTTPLADGHVQSWSKGVSVTAETTVHSIDGGGNFGLTGGLNGGAGSAAGGALLNIGRSSRTVAAIADGVTITASGVDVKARTTDEMYVVVTSSGRAQGAALSGMVGLANLDNQTLASISNRALVTADVVSVKAEQSISVLSVSGGIVAASTGGSSAGVSVGRIDASTVTRGYIGDNSGDLSDDRLRGAGTTAGRIQTDSLAVQAETNGWLSAASVAAAVVDGTMDFVTDDPFFTVVSAASASQGGGKPSFALAGSAAVASTQLGTSAWIDGATITAKTDAVTTTVAALNSTILELGSGSAAINLTGGGQGTSAALAGAIAFAKLDNSTDARINRSSLTNIGDTSVQALAGGRATVVGLGLAGSGGGNAAAAMSVALGLVTNSVSASIADSTLIAPTNIWVSNLVTVDAYQTTDIGIGGGAAYAGAKNGVGIALTYAEIRDPDGEDAVSAKVTRSTLTGADRLQVRATNASRIISSAITAGLGGNGLGGAFVINRVTPTTNAAISGVSGTLATISVSGDVVVLADGSRIGVYDDIIRGRQAVSAANRSEVDFSGAAANEGAAIAEGAAVLAIVGALQGGDNNVGVSVLSNTIAQSHIAAIDFATVTAGGDVSVVARDGATLTGIAVGLGIATGQFAGVASVAQQTIDNVIRARISGGGITSRDVAVQAQAASEIEGRAGTLAGSTGVAAVGLSIVDSSIANDVAAGIGGTQIRASGDVVLAAGSTARIDTVAIGLAMARNVGLAGSVANNNVATDIGATITGADIIAGNNLGVFAANTDRITVSAGALGATAASPGLAGGVSVVDNTVGGDTVARIEGSTVDARAGGTGSLSYTAGQLLTAFDLSTANGPSAAQPSLAMTARSIHGLGVVATSQQSVLANAVTGGIAAFPITGAVAIVSIRNVLGGSTGATIDASQVDTRLTGTGSTAIAVEAASHSYAATFINVGAIGGVAAAGANTSNIMQRSTRAALTNSTTGTTTPGYSGGGVGALDIAANASQSAASNVTGFALGFGGAAAMGVVNTFAASTSAALDQGLVTAGRVGVNADSRNGFHAQTVAVGAGGVGVGSAFIVGTSKNATLATIGGGSGQTVLNLNGGLAVAATSRNAFTTLATGGAAGGFAGVAGMVSFVDVDNETRAGLYGARVTIRPGAMQTVGSVTSAAGISVTAFETTNITPKTAAGANGSFGAGAAANIASLDSSVQADIQGSTLVAPGTVSASATSERTVSAETITYGIGGSVGIGASVALISVGTGTPSAAQGEITSGGGGTLSRIGQLTAGNNDLVLSAAGLASYRSYRGPTGAAMSESALRDAAQTDYNELLANGTVSGGTLTLSNAGVVALRSAAASALGIPDPDADQVRGWAAARYAALQGGAVGYLLSDAGVSAYRTRVTATTPDASDDQIRSAANDAYARLLANGTVSSGVLTLSTAGIDAYRAEANADLGRTATDAEVRNYAAQQYGFFTANRSRIAAPTAQSAAALLESTGSATSASVSGGSITSGAVAVSALSKTTTSNIASGVGAGGAAGVGAATAYTDIGDKVSARLDQINVSTGSIAVTASSTDGTGSAARIEARAGAGGLAAAAGAAVAKGTIDNEVKATLGGALTVTGATSVNASNSQTGRSDAFGATVAGGLALGISLASSEAKSDVEARYAGGSNLTGTGLTIGAQSTGAAHAAAVAGAGGLLAAGSGAEAKASDTTKVTASIGAGARANVGTGTISVSATASPDAKAAAFGVAVAGGLAVGAAIAEATVGAIVTSEIERNASLIANQFTAGLLSVTAAGSVFGTAAGDAVRLSDATSGFARGGYSAAASAVAGSGAYYVSAVGTDAKARNTTSVTASVGDYIGLSSGSVTISATNTTLQAAKATGITVAGTAAIGRINAQADAVTATTASLGASSTMGGSGTGRFILTATGEDTQIARAEAGSGGLYAGSGAEGSTSNTSDVTAALGANAVIVTGLATIGASHSTRYAALVDSLQAAALGASAALAKNNANVDVLTELGAGARITAAGPGTNGCYLTSCLQAISLTSRNTFTQLELGDSVRAAAGGGINGAGATSRTGLDGTSKVELKDGVVLIGGTSPTAAPGSILAQAWSELFGDDTATLTTGGLLQGAGVSTRYRAGSAQNPLTNTVRLGNNVVLTSFGAINLGTYTLADVTANAYVSTYGLAGVGLADADVTIRTDNKVLIGANSELLGLYDVNVTAGRDGADARRTTLSGTANALGYVRGLIAVPDADASTDLQHHARVEVGSGTRISSAQNVTLGAYEGVLDAEADGTGHGYQLYFIPVTTGSSSPGRSSSSTLVMNGTATAGIYNTQRIEIGCGANASVQCGPNEAPTIRFVSGAPVTASLTSTFDPVAYINARYEAAVASTLISGVNAGPVKAIRLSQLYAAGGNVFVSAGTVQGNGSLVARGGPSITVINRSNAYLVLDGGAYIPQSSGGQIIGSTGTLARSSNPDATPSIIIDNAYSRPLDPGDKGPALLIGGDITNLSGLVSINNTLGSFGFSGQRIDSLQFNITVPNGVVAVSSNGPNGMYNAGGSPQGEYNHAIYYPGGAPGSGSFDVNQAVIAAANALATAAGYGNNINYFLYGRQDEGATRNWSLQFFGNCAGYIANSGANCTGDYNMGRGINFYALPTIPTYRESNPTVAGSAPKIFGAQVAIKATTININASIEAGRITNWSGTVDAGMAASLRSQRQHYIDRGYVEVSLKEALGGSWANAGAAPVYYDIVNDRLVLWDVNASSGGGSVLLDGQIISTNTLGSIKINGGFGDVSLNNTSGLDLVVNRVNTGTGVGVAASVSKITIIDRLITSGPNTTVYAYTPGSGIAKYITHNGAQPILTGAGASVPVEFISGDLTRHETVAGTRYEWTQQALLQKVGLTEENRNQANIPGVYWRFDSGTSSNPWVYVDAQSPSTDPGEDPRFWWSRDAQAPSAELVSGRVVTGKTGLSHVGMTQEITGGHLDFIHNQASYGGCNGQAINHCDYDFVAKAGETQAKWDYNYATRAFVQITTSVKADNPFNISFAGNAAGRINITSNSSVLQNGTIVNPSGTTTIIASGGSFTQTNNATILSSNLNLSARDSIGTQTTAIKATLTAGAQLNATAGSGGINLDITGSAQVVALRADQNPAAYGDIKVQATGSLEAAATGGPHVVGRNITLVSEEGSIGSTSNLMRMRAVATQLPNGSHVDGIVNVRARGDIGVAQTVGDLRVGQIASAAGNVRIDVSAGRLVSASGQTAAQALSAEQLSQVSRALKLTAADGAGAAAQASVAAFEKQVTQSYGLYTALMRNGEMKPRTVNGVSRLVFTLNEDAIALYQAFADAAVGGTATEQQVMNYAESRYAAYAGVFEKAYGGGWASQARFNPATAESNFSFSVTASDAAPNLENRISGDAVWTERQLVSAINKSALEPASGVVGNGTALVIGRDITLNTAGSIGSLAPDVQVALSDIRNGTISNAQLAALAVATTAGSVKIIGQRQDGSLVEVTDLNNVPAGVTLSRVDVKQTAPLFINASGTFSGSAQGDVYVQATGTPQAAGGTLTIGRITATGTVSLQAPQAIAVATNAGGSAPSHAVQIQTNGDLVLVAGGGGIGSAATPLNYQIGGRLVSASAAAGDIHLVAKGGDAQIGRIFASGTASLTASAGSIRGYLPGVAISASSILLNATGNVGSASAGLGLQVGATGDVSGQIGGSAWLSAPAIGGQPATPLRIGEFSAADGVNAMADDEIRILRSLRSSNGAVSVSGGKIVMASGADIAAGGRISLASASDVQLGKVTSSWNTPAGSASILIAAAGAILGNGDAGMLLSATGTGGMIDLRAGTGIGSEAAALTFASPHLAASSLAGDIHLAAAGATHVMSLLASTGAASLVASGNLTVDAATTGSGASIASTAGTLDITSLRAGATSTLSAGGTVTLGDASVTAGHLAVSSTGAGLSLAGLNVTGDLTLAAATSITATGALLAGGAMEISAQNGPLSLASLAAGGAATLDATGAIDFSSATTTTGAFSARSHGAGITAGSIAAATVASLNAAGPISITTSLTAGGAANVTSTAGALDIASLTAGAGSTLLASGAVTLGEARTTAGDLAVTSTGAGLSLAGLDSAGKLTLNAATSIAATGALLAGGALDATAQNGTLTLAGLSSGGAATLDATGAIGFTSATTTAGAFSALSRGAGITASAITAASGATLAGAGPISVTTALTAAEAANVTTTAGTLGIASLTAGASSTLSASGAVTLGDARTTTGDLAITSTGAGLSLAGMDVAGGLTLTAATSITATGSLLAGRALDAGAQNGALTLASLSAAGPITLDATGALGFTSATTTAGAFSALSRGAGIMAGTITAANGATLTAAGPISITTSLIAGAAANVTTTAGTLGIASLTASASSTLSATGAVTLGDARTTAGDLAVTSTGAGLSLAGLDSAGKLTLTAATSIAATGALLAGGALDATAQNGTLTLASLSSGGAATLDATGPISLTSATTRAGAFSALSRGAGITAGTITAANEATLTAAGPISLAAALIAGAAANVTTTAGTLDIASLRAGASSTLSASGAVTLGDATITAGDLAVTSTGADLSLAGLDVAGKLTLSAATSIASTGALLAGDAMEITAQTGALTLARLSSGAAAKLDATGPIGFGSATTTAGAFSALSRGAGITAGTITAANGATLTAAGPISITTSLIAGEAANVISTAGKLDIASLRAGASSALSASGTVTLGDVTTLAGELSVTSAGAGIRAKKLSTAERLSVAAADSIHVEAFEAGSEAVLEAGSRVQLTRGAVRDGGVSIMAAAIEAGGLQSGTTLGLLASGSVVVGRAEAGTALSIRSSTATIYGSDLKAGQSVSIDAAHALMLGNVVAGQGGISATSRSAGITAKDLRTTGNAMLSGFGSVSADSLSAQDAKATAATGSLAIAALDATGSVMLRSGSTLSVDRLASAASTDIEARDRLTIGTLLAGGDIRLTSAEAGVAVSTARAGASMRVTAERSIEGGTVTAQDALVLLAGRSGQGSLRLAHGAARQLVGTAPDEVQLARFTAGDSIVIMGTRIAADIVQGTGSGLPLALDISGFRSRSAERVDLAVEAGSFRASRLAAIDARLTTTAGQLRIAEAFIPGSLTLTTPSMTVLANNRSLAPDPAYDVQLHSMGRPFYLDLDRTRLTTNAHIVRFDSDIVEIPPTAGGSLTRDMARLGAWLTAGATAEDVAGGFRYAPNGHWWSAWGAGSWNSGPFGRPRGFVFAAEPGRLPVNLDETEDRP